jgi:hypothetical protein
VITLDLIPALIFDDLLTLKGPSGSAHLIIIIHTSIHPSPHPPKICRLSSAQHRSGISNMSSPDPTTIEGNAPSQARHTVRSLVCWPRSQHASWLTIPRKSLSARSLPISCIPDRPSTPSQDSKAKSTAMAIIASARKSSRSASGSPEGYDAGIVQEVIEKGRTRKDGAKKGGEGRREWRCPLGDD